VSILQISGEQVWVYAQDGPDDVPGMEVGSPLCRIKEHVEMLQAVQHNPRERQQRESHIFLIEREAPGWIPVGLGQHDVPHGRMQESDLLGGTHPDPLLVQAAWQHHIIQETRRFKNAPLDELG
jgi:hypothetical protein